MNPKKKILMLAVLALFIVSCGGGATEETSEKDALLAAQQEIELLNDNVDIGEMPAYATSAPGTSEKLDRAFENAPPMIPHNTEGFFPIKANSNICLSCHMPEVAEAVKSIPIPETHMHNYRPEMKVKNGKYELANGGKTMTQSLDGKLSSAYFNCSQCHAPQADITVEFDNLFTPEFRDSISKSRSDLIDRVAEGL
jgi:cytochrome c-type protein NapB